MTVPDRTAAAALLLDLDPKPWLLRHSRAVAEIAGWLAFRAVANGVHVDRRLVEAAALLHDIDKLLPSTDPARVLPHGDGSAAYLARHGHPELARTVAAHPVTRLVGDTPASGSGASPFGTWEERIVAYADKRAGQRLEPIDARFASWRRRYPGSWDDATAELARERAGELEATVCRAAGTRPDGVRRLRWTEAAFRAAGQPPRRSIGARGLAGARTVACRATR